MKLLKKLAVTVHSQVEAMADRFENKESISTAYIREYERAVAKTKVRLAQAEGEVARLEREAARLREQANLWAKRARRVHTEDEAKALDCVARMKETESDLRRIRAELAEAGRLRRKMARDVDQILEKLEALKRRHQDLAARQACAEAAGALQDAEGGTQQDVDELFARWETEVVARELGTQAAPVGGDSLAEEFEASERQSDLRSALAELLANPGSREEEKP